MTCASSKEQKSQIAEDKDKLEKDMIALINDFEAKYPEFSLDDTFTLKRYNGSNNAYGRVIKIYLKVSL